MKNSVFVYSNYKDYMSDKLGERSKGKVSNLADAAGCQRSYMSQVLNQHAHLTPEHALGLTEHWEMSSQEADYFLLLVDFARAGTKKMRDRLSEKMKSIKAQQQNLAHRFKEVQLYSLEDQTVYYSSWIWAAVHILASIPAYQTVSTIGRRLHLPDAHVKSVLQKLELMGLVRRDADRWLFSGPGIHLGKDSPLIALNHANMRALAVLEAQGKRDDSLHYSGISSLSRDDYQRLHDTVLRFIDEIRAAIAPSKEEELVVFNVDFFSP